MHELTPEAAGLPPMTPEARRAFARLTHATAHEAMALRALQARMRHENVTSIEQVHALVTEMVTERAQRIGSDPASVCDAYEAASAQQLMDVALVQGMAGHA